jgi:hypothetical protein
MKDSIIKTQKGIGLIEVLVTTVVVAVGLLAVASLQGNFLASSGDSKIRSEALVLAQKKLEEFRNTVDLTNASDTGFSDVLTAGSFTDSSNPIAGTNASFSRSWTITDIDPPIPPFTADDLKLKTISVQVGWDANGDNDSSDADEVVNVVTQLPWIDPTKSSLYAETNSGGSTSVASPRQNASEEAASEQVLGTDLAITDLVPLTEGSAGVDSEVQVTLPPSSGGTTITLTQVATGSHYYTATYDDLSSIQQGVIAIFLCGDNETCTHVQNHFGGVPHRIAGTVYTTSPNGFTDLKVAWTSSSISDCYNQTNATVVSGSGSNQFRYKAYECIFAGNCDKTGNINGCTYGVTPQQIEAKMVGPGGEYGDVGLIGLDDQGSNREQVCFLEDTADPATSPLLTPNSNTVLNEGYLYSVTKRFYAARRIKRNGSVNNQKSEGINRSYTNHNFLVVPRSTGATANQTCNLKAVERGIELAPREIFQTLDEGVDNVSLAESDYPGATGTAKTFTGVVNSNATNLKLIIPDVGNCYLNNNSSGATPTAYACVVANGTTSIDIKGGSEQYPGAINNKSVFASCTKTDNTACAWTNNFTAVAAPSSDCTTPWGDTVSNGGSVQAKLNEQEPFGGSCSEETRVCTNGTLSGSYEYQNCDVANSPDCLAPWGVTITNGQSRPAYNTQEVPAGTSCASVSETRVCTDGILSGSYSFGDCAEQTTRIIQVETTSSGTGSVSGISITGSGSGASCVSSTNGYDCTVANDWSGTLTATGTCSGGGSVTGTTNVSAGETSATISLGSCTGPVCTTTLGTTVASGSSILTYSAATVLSPSTCASISETRFCYDGALTGSYTFESCSVIPTYTISVVAANGSGSVTASTCNTGSCSGLVAGTYTVAATLSGGNTCSKSYTITNSNRTVTVTKASGQGTVCSMSP